MRPTNIAYLDLTPDLTNAYIDQTHDIFRKWLQENPVPHPPDYTVDFIIVTKRGTDKLLVKGPSKSKRLKVYEYTIYLPDKVSDLSHYIELVSEGIESVFPEYNRDAFVAYCKNNVGTL